MIPLVPALAALLSAAAAFGIGLWLRRQGSCLPPVFLYLLLALPFAAGGFHSYTAAVTTAVLLVDLLMLARKNKGLRLVYNLNSLTVLTVTVFYCVSPLWAADKGMAVFGILKALPLLLLALMLMQRSPEERASALAVVPYSGAAMTIVSCLLLLCPNLVRYVTVDGRLSSFMQYPNTFAMFLLAGLVLNNTKNVRRKFDLPVDAVLVAGILLSGSRMGAALLLIAVAGLAVLNKKKKELLLLGISLAAAVGIALVASALGLSGADRLLGVLENPHSLMVRLLYYKDALPVIAKHPLGLGYLGYRTMEGVFQTGRYAVVFVHNGLLQLLLDIGWVPGLLMAAALVKTLFSKKTPAGNRLLLLLLLGHCLVDFDLEFFLFWVLILLLLDFDKGEVVRLQKGTAVGKALFVAALTLSLWLGAGDLLYNLGYTDASLTVTPFHTDALCAKLVTCARSEEVDALADRILRQNPDNALAWNAKADAAFSRGWVADMMEYKEAALRCDRYATEYYADYFEKLWVAREGFLQMGDTDSASVCADKLRAIPQWMAAVSTDTDPLAYRAGMDQTLVLPEEYTALLAQLG